MVIHVGQYSMDDLRCMTAAQQIHAAATDQVPPGFAVYMCDTPDVLVDMGAERYPVLYGITHLKQALNAFDIEMHYHGMQESQLAMIAQTLGNPMAVMDSIQREDSLVIIPSVLVKTEEYSGFQTAIVAMHPHGIGSLYGTYSPSNYITSIYPKEREHVVNQILGAYYRGNLLYLNKDMLIGYVRSWNNTFADRLERTFRDVPSNTILHQSRAIRLTNLDPDHYNRQYTPGTEEYDIRRLAMSAEYQRRTAASIARSSLTRPTEEPEPPRAVHYDVRDRDLDFDLER